MYQSTDSIWFNGHQCTEFPWCHMYQSTDYLRHNGHQIT